MNDEEFCGEGSPKSTMIAIGFAESVAAPTAATHYVKRRYAIPSGRVLKPDHADSTVTTAGTRTLIGIGRKLGSFAFNAVPASGVFTPANGGGVVAPKHYSRLFAIVTTALGGTGSPSIIATYTNHVDTAARASVASVIPISAPVGNAFEMILQADAAGPGRDVGIRSLQTVVDSVGNNGASAAVDIIGINAIHDAQGAANAQEDGDVAHGLARFPEEVFILLFQAATTAQQRRANITGVLSLMQLTAGNDR